MPSETHAFLVNGWNYMKSNEHLKGKLHSDGAVCLYGGLLVGNGISTSECRTFYPPFTNELEKFNPAARLLQKWTPEGGNVPKFNDLGWVPKELVVAIFAMAIEEVEKLEGVPPYQSALNREEVKSDNEPASAEIVIPVENYGDVVSGPAASIEL